MVMPVIYIRQVRVLVLGRRMVVRVRVAVTRAGFAI